MITFIVKANVKPGQVETLKEALLASVEFISAHEPGWANYAYFSPDEEQVTFINVVNDSDALTHHFSISPQNEPGKIAMGALEITDVEIYGELSAEAEKIVNGMNPLRRIAQSGTFDRTLAVK